VSHARFVAIHGHFYQPPRESPWLERIEVQDSAAPYHDWASVAAGEASLAIGRVRVTARTTGESEEADVAVLHAGGGEAHCRVRTGGDASALATARVALFREFPGPGPAAMPHALDTYFAGRSYGTNDVFIEERRRLLARLAERTLQPAPGAGDRIDESSRRLLTELRAIEGPIPPALAGVARPLLARAARDELTALAAGGPVRPRIDRIREVLAEARSLGIALALPPELIAPPIEAALGRVLGEFRASPPGVAVGDALALVAVAAALEVVPTLWAAQNEAARLWRAGSLRDRDVLAPLMAALGFALPIPREEG
jgi:hypothetical protein